MDPCVKSLLSDVTFFVPIVRQLSLRARAILKIFAPARRVS